jgi:hypothetical protein
MVALILNFGMSHSLMAPTVWAVAHRFSWAAAAHPPEKRSPNYR